MRYIQKELNELWDGAKSSGAGLDWLECRARIITGDVVEQRNRRVD